MMAWTRRQLAIAHGAQLAAQRLLDDRHAIFVEQPLDQIYDPPAHHTMRRRDRALLDNLGKRPLMLWAKHWTGTGGFAIEHKPSGPLALKRSTQSRTVCKPTPPTCAAARRVPPS